MLALSTFTEAAGRIGKTASFPRDAALTDLTDEGVIRAYYLEVSKNIEVLKTVDSTTLKDESLHSPGFKSLVQSLEAGAGFTLLCSGIGKRKRIRSFLQETLVIQSPGRSFVIETGEEDEDAKPPEVFALRVDVLKAVTVGRHPWRPCRSKARGTAPASRAKAPTPVAKAPNPRAVAPASATKAPRLPATAPTVRAIAPNIEFQPQAVIE